MTYNIQVNLKGAVTSDNITNAINSFTYTAGSVDGFDIAQAGVLNVSFLNNTFNNVTIQPTDLLGSFVQLAGDVSTPYMTITSVDVTPIDSSASNNLISITAYGALSRLSRDSITTGSIPSQAGYLTLVSLNDAIVYNWNSINGAILWDDYPTNFTWNSFSYTQPTIDCSTSLGTRDDRIWLSQSGITENLLAYVQSLATATDSWVYEVDDNSVFFLPNSQLDQSSGLSLDASVVMLFDSVTSNWDLSQKYNDVTVTNGTLTYYAADGADIAQFGSYPATVTSQLSNGTDLTNFANRILDSHSGTISALSRVTLDCDKMAYVLDVTFPSNVTFTNLPTIYTPTDGTTFQIRGGTIRGTLEHIEQDLVLVPASVWKYGTTAWYEISTSDTWATYASPTTQWQNVS